MDIVSFITEHYIAFIIAGIVILMTIIGYIAQKTGFGAKISKANKDEENTNKVSNDENVEVLNDIDINSSDGVETDKNEVEQLDILDTIAPDFNNEGLMVGDINQNPAVSNEELGIPEDLYAPFGDQEVKLNNEPNIDDLKIEDVEENDDFNIITKENTNDNDEDQTEVISEINESLSPKEENNNIEDLKIEEVDPNKAIVAEEPKNEVVETINDLVDNTFVINDGTSDFNSIDKIEEKKDDDINNQSIASNENNNPGEKSKVEQFEIDENSFPEEINSDLELEATTNLKLDEINEQIKNLKLEDFDNPIVETQNNNLSKKKSKKKQVSIKSVDELKNKQSDNSSNEIELNLPDLNTVIENNLDNKSSEDNVTQNTDDASENNEVSEEDIWNF